MAETEYRKKLFDIEEIPAQDDLSVAECMCSEIVIGQAGEYARGDILMSSGGNVFTKATESGIESAKEISVMSEDMRLEDEDVPAITVGYFLGVYLRPRLSLNDGAVSDEVLPVLRKHGIYVR